MLALALDLYLLNQTEQIEKEVYERREESIEQEDDEEVEKTFKIFSS
jgi:hypothetical protein